MGNDQNPMNFTGNEESEYRTIFSLVDYFKSQKKPDVNLVPQYE